MRQICDSIIDQTNRQYELSTSIFPDSNEVNYLAGLSDALEIVKSIKEDQLIVGGEYYVLVWDDYIRDTLVQKRKLSKITITESRTTYTFSFGKDDTKPITLYGKGGLGRRVFKTYYEAMQGKNHVYLDQKIQY